MGEVLLGVITIPLGKVLRILPLATLAFANWASTLKTALLLTFPVLLLHLLSGKKINELLRQMIRGIFGTQTSESAAIRCGGPASAEARSDTAPPTEWPVTVLIAILLSASAGKSLGQSSLIAPDAAG
jgi:hypothetical protein